MVKYKVLFIILFKEDVEILRINSGLGQQTQYEVKVARLDKLMNWK